MYALGVMLYGLLTGSPPHDAKQFKRGAILEMLRMVREVEPPRPSTKLSTSEALPNIAANRDIEPAKLAKLLRGELDWVVMKALEKDRSRRYDTANGLARDLQRYLADEVVEARPPSRGYRLRKFVRRNKGQVIAATLVVPALLGGMIGAVYGFLEAGNQRIANALRELAELDRDAAKVARAEAETARDRETKRSRGSVPRRLGINWSRPRNGWPGWSTAESSRRRMKCGATTKRCAEPCSMPLGPTFAGGSGDTSITSTAHGPGVTT